MLGCNQAAIQQFLVETRDDRQDDDDLRDVRGDQFLPELVGAVQQRGARVHSLDHALAGCSAHYLDTVAASERTAFAARNTGQDFGTGQLDKILPAEIPDDQAVMQSLRGAQRLFRTNANRRRRQRGATITGRFEAGER